MKSEKDETPEEKANREHAATFMYATMDADDYFAPELDYPEDDPAIGTHEDDGPDPWDDYDIWDAAREQQEQRDEWLAEEEERQRGVVPEEVASIPRERNGRVRILGRDSLKLGATVDVEYGERRQTIEVVIVEIDGRDPRLCVVVRTDGKKWEHSKTHTRIVKP